MFLSFHAQIEYKCIVFGFSLWFHNFPVLCFHKLGVAVRARQQFSKMKRFRPE